MSSELTTQEISNMSWALAKLWNYDMPLLAALSSQAIRHISSLNRQELSITAWAFATMGLRPQPLLQAIAASAIRTMSDFTMLEISNTAWAFAQLAERNSTLIDAIAAASIAICGEGCVSPVSAPGDGMAPNGLYSIAWSSWRSMRPDLSRWLFQLDPSVAVREPVVCGLFVMDSEWHREERQERSLTSSLHGGEPDLAGRELFTVQQ
mmetsp:Transcript_15920/g.36129  ORF Transcript_15920/g.36129 Transcript_15920/m.36129 type:complete len:208 (+) Transcript_15920:664-1287(+)